MEADMISTAGGKAEHYKGGEALTKLKLALKGVQFLLERGEFTGAVFIGDSTGRMTIANIKVEV